MHVRRFLPSSYSPNAVVLVAVVALILPATAAVLRGEAPIGGDDGQHDEIRALAAAVGALPPGSLVYDHWLGWELGFYLGENPAARLVFQPSPEAFGRAVCAGADTAYLASPHGAEGRWLYEAERQGALVTRLAGERLRLYRLDCP